MPVIIEQDSYGYWLDKQATEETTEQLLTQDSYQGILVKPISNWVNNPCHNDKNCLN